MWGVLSISVALGLVHLAGGKMRFLDVVPRSRWLSFAGGVAVSYVCVHLLPELSKAQGDVQEIHKGLRYFERHVYVVALVGLVLFYGLERAAKRSRHENRKEGGSDRTSYSVFSLHMATYSAYNLLIGYLLVHRDADGSGLPILFAIAMGLHFLANDYGLRQDHKEAYRRVGQWILAAAVPMGCALGLVTRLHKAAPALLFAFLSGGVILNVFKEELPEERQSRLGAFACGATAYAVILLFTQ